MNFEAMTVDELINYQNENFNCVECLASCSTRQKDYCVNKYNLINELIMRAYEKETKDKTKNNYEVSKNQSTQE
jgi:hypothetical protein